MRKESLEKVRVQLKNEFVGIDDPIDEIIDLVHSWYCFPDGQVRPTVINMVGMTGVGKTSLIERMFALLDIEQNFYKFDMGYYANPSSSIRDDISQKVRSYNGEPIAFVLDEFQLSRSLDSNGNELDRPNFRSIWDLLDSGKLHLIEKNYNIDTLHLLMMKLEYITSKGVSAKGLYVQSGEKLHNELFGNGNDEEYEEESDDSNKDKKVKFIPTSYYYYIKNSWPNRFMSNGILEEFLSEFKTHEEAIAFLNETIEHISKPKIYDFSNAIIFNISNIDDVYVGSRQMDPDVDADILHKYSKNIGLFDVKAALSLRFRPEQVARLGNNYVIYPSLSSAAYRGIVAMELDKISKNVENKFGIKINFDKSIHDIMYKEGVFPTQGARPIFTTINSAITSFIGRVMSHVEESGMRNELKTIDWSFKRGKNIYVFRDASGKEMIDRISFPVKIKVESLRRANQDDSHAITAVHESGHALVASVLLGIIPNKIMSATAGPSEGFNQFIWDKVKDLDYLKKIVAVYMGGLEAERIVFGELKATNGGSSDTKALTNLVLEMVANSGLIINSKKHYNPEPESNSSIYDKNNDTTEFCNKIIDSAQIMSNNAIVDHRKALIALSARLFEKTTLKKKEVESILRENGVDIEVNKRDGKDFYKKKLIDEFSKFNMKVKVLKRKKKFVEIEIGEAAGDDE